MRGSSFHWSCLGGLTVIKSGLARSCAIDGTHPELLVNLSGGGECALPWGLNANKVAGACALTSDSLGTIEIDLFWLTLDG